MQLQVKGKNVEVSESIRDYAETKLRKLERQLADPTKVELELTVEKNPSIAASHVAEATIWTKGPTLRARESAPDVRASIDLLVDKLERQVTRYREKRQRARPSHAPERARRAVWTSLRSRREESQLIVKTKQFIVQPMSAEEAVLQLELVGHDFFVFRSAETERAERGLPAQRRQVRADRAAEPVSLSAARGAAARAAPPRGGTRQRVAATRATRGRHVPERAEPHPLRVAGRASTARSGRASGTQS